jgi:ribose transport system ATP-binding protein
MVDDRAMNGRTGEVLASIGARCHPRDRVGPLPLAQRELVQIARALLEPRKVVIFDEPTAVLANDEVAALLDVVGGLRARGATVLYISHLLDEVEALADRVTVLRDGRMIGTWPAQGLTQRAMVDLMVGREWACFARPSATCRRLGPSLWSRGCPSITAPSKPA